MFGLPSFLVPLIGAVVVAAGGFYAGLRWDDGVIQHMKADAATAALSAQKQADQIQSKDQQLAQANGVAEAATQTALEAKARTITKEVPVYVTKAQDARGCVTWGMLRVHDAAALGVDPASLLPPAGQSDDNCSPTPVSTYAAAVASNYAIALQNAQQLNDLEADIRQRVAAFNGETK